MPPVEEVDIAAVRYKSPTLQAPHLTGFSLRAFLWLMESSLLGPLVTSVLKSQNNMPQVWWFPRPPWLRIPLLASSSTPPSPFIHSFLVLIN
jgi:hypothetical protein